MCALGLLTDKGMVYFERVHMVFGEKRRTCYLCISKHAVIFMRQDLNSKIQDGKGELSYSEILKVLVDESSQEHFMIKLADASQWGTDVIHIVCENRDLLLQHMKCCWQTDYMMRNRKVATFPRALYPITTKSDIDPEVKAFKEFHWQKFRGYKFMIEESFVPQPNAIQASETGEWLEKETGIVLSFHVHGVMTMEELSIIQRDHIRWVAAEYKAHFVKEESQFYVLRNDVRTKRMNLSGDVAAWYSWELIIRTRTHVIISLIFRRQYIPPLCDNAQDIALTLKIPADIFVASEVGKILQAIVMADTISPTATPSIYPELIQAKLDGLLLDEDGMEWVGNHTKLVSRWRHEAKQFLRTILTIIMKESKQSGLIPEDVLTNKKYLIKSAAREEWVDVEADWDLMDCGTKMRERGEGLGEGREAASDKELACAKNRWLARVARYFAWAVDGGLLGHHFTIDKLIEVLPRLTADNEEKVRNALMFMLHMRDVDAREEWTHTTDTELLLRLTGQPDKWEFNDRVMQQLISDDYIRKQCRINNSASSALTSYYKCLANLLLSKTGVNLRAYICRIFMEMKLGSSGAKEGNRDKGGDDDSKVVAIPALVELCKNGGTYLATWASAALVNMSHTNELVKMRLMSQGMASAAVKNMQSKDDDLINYTLRLMVNLTKESHHRAILANAGVLPLLYDMLTSSYHQCKGTKGVADSLGSAILANNMKEKILERICSIIGHFCKDEEHRDHLIDSFEHTVKCCIYIATHCGPFTPLMSKVMFVLKQLCAARADQKRQIGIYVLRHMCAVMQDAEAQKQADVEYISHAMQLFLMLSTFKDNCMILYEKRVDKVLLNLSKAPASKKLGSFEGNRKRILELVEEASRKAIEMT